MSQTLLVYTKSTDPITLQIGPKTIAFKSAVIPKGRFAGQTRPVALVGTDDADDIEVIGRARRMGPTWIEVIGGVESGDVRFLKDGPSAAAKASAEGLLPGILLGAFRQGWLIEDFAGSGRNEKYNSEGGRSLLTGLTVVEMSLTGCPVRWRRGEQWPWQAADWTPPYPDWRAPEALATLPPPTLPDLLDLVARYNAASTLSPEMEARLADLDKTLNRSDEEKAADEEKVRAAEKEMAARESAGSVPADLDHTDGAVLEAWLRRAGVGPQAASMILLAVPSLDALSRFTEQALEDLPAVGAATVAIVQQALARDGRPLLIRAAPAAPASSAPRAEPVTDLGRLAMSLSALVAPDQALLQDYAGKDLDKLARAVAVIREVAAHGWPSANKASKRLQEKDLPPVTGNKLAAFQALLAKLDETA